MSLLKHYIYGTWVKQHMFRNIAVYKHQRVVITRLQFLLKSFHVNNCPFAKWISFRKAHINSRKYPSYYYCWWLQNITWDQKTFQSVFLYFSVHCHFYKLCCLTQLLFRKRTRFLHDLLFSHSLQCPKVYIISRLWITRCEYCYLHLLWIYFTKSDYKFAWGIINLSELSSLHPNDALMSNLKQWRDKSPFC